jgi:hypothetical protein
MSVMADKDTEKNKGLGLTQFVSNRFLIMRHFPRPLSLVSKSFNNMNESLLVTTF